MSQFTDIGEALEPRAKEKVPYTKAQAHENRRTLFMVLGIVAVAALWFICGLVLGREHAYYQLPNCEEDEVLYVKGDYVGPGDNSFSDYGCIPADDL